MKAGIIAIFGAFLCFLLMPSTSFAQEVTSQPSASFADINAVQKADDRAQVLQKYLTFHESPMAPFASDFVTQADLNHIPWHLLAAIAGTESTFGQHEPTLDCHNGWGFGIYGKNVLCFPSYSEAIKTISRTLRDQYIDKYGARDVYDIGKFYAASPTWGQHTAYFMHDIEEFKQQYELNSLSISL